MKNVICRFIVTSDIHFRVDSYEEHSRFEKGMRMAYEYASKQPYNKIDAFIADGDFANSGKPEEMKLFKEYMDKGISADAVKMLTLASHEFFYDGPETAYKLFDEIFGLPADNHVVINGIHFISFSCSERCRFNDDKREFLTKALKEAAADGRKKPIFVFQHPHPQMTVYGSSAWGEDEFMNQLIDYPQVIDFSGHSHAPINDPRSVHQKYFTSLGTGSFSYFELDEFDMINGTVPPDAHTCGQFYIVEVNDDYSVKAIPVDVISGKFFNDGIVIEEPWNPDSFVYTAARAEKEVAPVFAENTPVEIENADGKIKVTFGQAIQQPQRTDSYTLKIKGADGFYYAQRGTFSSYYIYDMPETVTMEFPCDLPAGEYEAIITANGFFGKVSQPITKKFTV